LKKLKIIVSVTNDLVTDQRVHKVCNTLYNQNFDVLLIGRKLSSSATIDDRNYNCKRMELLFNKGVLFYAEYQIRLFLFLLFSKFDVLHSNDLDTLLPNYLASIIKRKPIVYDTHEYFTEVPELQNSPLKKRIWLAVEKYIFPKLKYIFSVNNSVANIYTAKYNVPVDVIRNVPLASKNEVVKFELPTYLANKPYCILQGAGINIDRGAEELLQAMLLVTNINLLIVGNGDVVPQLKNFVRENSLENCVFFVPKQPYHILVNYTKNAVFGLTLDKDTNLNYKYSLPNKIFDYIHANIPVLASPLIETQNIFNEFEIGCIVQKVEPYFIAEKINFIMSNDAPVKLWKENLSKLAATINWETESKVLVKTYNQIRDNII